jgi:hypothetical protein
MKEKTPLTVAEKEAIVKLSTEMKLGLAENDLLTEAGLEVLVSELSKKNWRINKLHDIGISLSSLERAASKIVNCSVSLARTWFCNHGFRRKFYSRELWAFR